MKVLGKFMYGGKSTYKKGGTIRYDNGGNTKAKYNWDDYQSLIQELKEFKREYGNIGRVGPGVSVEDDFSAAFWDRETGSVSKDYDKYIEANDALYAKMIEFNKQGYNMPAPYVSSQDAFKAYDLSAFQNSRQLYPEQKTGKGASGDTQEGDLDTEVRGTQGDNDSQTVEGADVGSAPLTGKEKRQDIRTDRIADREQRRAERQARRARNRADRIARRTDRASGDITPQSREREDYTPNREMDYNPNRDMDYAPNKEMNYEPQTMQDGGVTDDKAVRRNRRRKKREERRSERIANRKSTM